MLSNATIIKNDDGSSNVALFLDGEAYLAHSSHANYKEIVSAISAGDLDADYESLFDTGKLVQGKFEAALAQVADQDLSERISVRGGAVTLDGDPVGGALEDQILHFVREGADFGPLVNFYEKLVTNPLGNVKEGVFSFAVANGLTITEDGDLLGYKSVYSGFGGFHPTRTSASGGDRVNGVEVGAGNHIVQNEGDVVEMPRSKVLNAPSAMCGDGLHVGTFDYADRFSGDTVLLVRFNPRDIVSLPDSNSAWKLRVCRYTVIEPVTEALDIPVYMTGAPEPETVSAGDNTVKAGDRIVDVDGDVATVSEDDNGDIWADYDEGRYGTAFLDLDEGGSLSDPEGYFVLADSVEGRERLGEEVEVATEATASESEDERAARRTSRSHGKGGKHSAAAEGNGLNPAQDPTTGQFVNGRPGSQRNGSTGRFTSV